MEYIAHIISKLEVYFTLREGIMFLPEVGSYSKQIV